MLVKDRVKNVLEILSNKFGDAKTELLYETEYQLMVAVILSAQCTDKRVNIVTRDLFKVVREPKDIYNMDIEILEKYIKSTGFYKAKARNIKENAKTLVEKYNGEIPKNMEQLLELGGVGRKTANVVLGDLWGIKSGIVVDTHVKRLSNRIGFVDNDNVEQIEKKLMKLIPKKMWYYYSHYLILQGRDKCIARKPKCSQCEIKEFCKYYENNIKK